MQQSDCRNTGTTQRSPEFRHFLSCQGLQGKVFGGTAHSVGFFCFFFYFVIHTYLGWTSGFPGAICRPALFNLCSCFSICFSVCFLLPPGKRLTGSTGPELSLGQSSQCTVTHTLSTPAKGGAPCKTFWCF